MLAHVAVLAQLVAAPLQSGADARPVRLWLGASPVAPGEVVPVYVAAAEDGYLLVLRVATDGRVEVVFPADPKADGYVARGAYELRAPGNRPALVANERRGTGLVLAALSATPFRFSEFAQAGRWDRGLLVASYPGADGPGTLTDVAQRMMGDGWFNYDFALYTVRPEPSVQPRADARGQQDPAAAPTIGVCNGCTIVYQTVSPAPVLEQTVVERTIIEPVVILASVCEPGAGGCSPSGFRRRHHRPDAPKVKTEGICQIGIDCPPGVGAPAKALTMRRWSAPGPSPAALAAPVTVTAQRVVLVSQPTHEVVVMAPVSRPIVQRRDDVSPRAPGESFRAVASPPATRTIAVSRGSTGGAMTARQAGTALRAARLLPRRR